MVEFLLVVGQREVGVRLLRRMQPLNCLKRQNVCSIFSSEGTDEHTELSGRNTLGSEQRAYITARTHCSEHVDKMSLSWRSKRRHLRTELDGGNVIRKRRLLLGVKPA